MRLGEYLDLLVTGMENLAFRTGILAREATRFGWKRWWWRLRLAMALHWQLLDPVLVSRGEGAQAGLSEDDLVYGETPPLTAHHLLVELQAGPEDIVVDLGCGRGHLLFVAALAFGARGVGVDALPTFISKGNRMARSLALEERLEFRQGDFRTQPLPRGTVYFLSGTALPPDSWRLAARRLGDAPPGSRTASLSSPLPATEWETWKVERLPFSWGEARVYYQRRRG